MECELISRLDEAFFRFVDEHKSDDTARLLLGRPSGDIVDIPFAVTQIESRRKHRSKLPEFVANSRFIFPDAASGEMASCAEVARYNACVAGASASFCDLTAGLGIDFMAIGRNAAHSVAVEYDPFRAAVLRHNLEVLGFSNSCVVNADSMLWLAESDLHFDVIFIDPARRDGAGKRSYGLADCVPDLTRHCDMILSHTSRLLVKASPMLDVTQTLRELPQTRRLHIVSSRGECKEILAELMPDGNQDLGPVEIVCVDIRHDGISVFRAADAHTGRKQSLPFLAAPDRIRPGMWLYQPNASVMKAGCHDALCDEWPDLRKADVNTHLYVSEQRHDSFPGRVLEIIEIPDKKRLKSLTGSRLNVVARNYPSAAEEISRRYRLRPSDEDYLYAMRVAGKPVLLLARLAGANTESVSSNL